MSTPELLKTPAPSQEMVDMFVMQIEAAMSAVLSPDYVDKAAKEFVAAMKRWAAEGK